MFRIPTFRGAIGAFSLVMLGLGSTTVSIAQNASNDAGQLEEITVTARKTQESLQSVPESVAAITGSELAERSLTNLSDVGQWVPNVTFNESGGGTGRGNSVIYIRGIGQLGNGSINYEPAVGVYLDGVYLNGLTATDLDMLNIDRVEILRGPQGTLFGRNTEAGAVNIVTRQPDLQQVSGMLQATTGNYDRADFLGSVNLPLITDKAALQVSLGRLYQNGYGTRVDGQDTGNTDRWEGRAQLLYKATDKLSILMSVDGVTYDQSNAVDKLVAINDAAPVPTNVNSKSPVKFNDQWLSPSDYFSYATGPNLDNGRIWGTALTINYEAPWATIKSISAYRTYDTHNYMDFDDSPINIFNNDKNFHENQLSQELQATGKSLSDRLNWVLGLYYLHAFDTSAMQAILLPDIVPGCGACFENNAAQTTNSFAGYGQSDYSLTDKLKFTAGLRLTRDLKTYQGSSTTYPVITITSLVPPEDNSWNDVSPRIGLDYQWTKDIMTYVSAAKGYKGGGFNDGLPSQGNQAFREERVWTYELGLRSDFFEHRMRFNATAYYNDYRDLQVAISSTIESGGTPFLFSVVDNIPKARIYGSEVELAVVPVVGLTLTGGLGLTYAKYIEFPTDAFWVAAGPISTGAAFLFTPEQTVTLAADYTRHATNTLLVTGHVDYVHKSTIYFDTGPDAGLPHATQNPYGLLNARLTFEYEPSKLSFSLFGTNLTNQYYFTGAYDAADHPANALGFSFQNAAPPREYGVSLRWDF
jgi:iron complex outermembrane receptor protein